MSNIFKNQFGAHLYVGIERGLDDCYSIIVLGAKDNASQQIDFSNGFEIRSLVPPGGGSSEDEEIKPNI